MRAVKVLKVYTPSNLPEVAGVCSPAFQKASVDQLTFDCAEVLYGGCYMDIPSPSERVAVVGTYPLLLDSFIPLHACTRPARGSGIVYTLLITW